MTTKNATRNLQSAGPLFPAATTVDYAYAAGLIDGEGCIHIARVKRTCGNRINYRLRLSICQNCLTTLQYVQQVMGGGRIFLCKRHLQHTRQVYNLVFDGSSAHLAIAIVAPFLRRKAGEAGVALAFYANGQPHLHPGPNGTPAAVWKFRKWCYNKLRKMK